MSSRKAPSVLASPRARAGRGLVAERLAPIVQTAIAMSFGIYLFGIVLVIGGLIYAAALLHVPVQWIVVTTLLLLGIGIVAAVKATRQRDQAK